VGTLPNVALLRAFFLQARGDAWLPATLNSEA